jgi:hypothetical protein
MTVPVFEEYDPAPDCDCPGCAERRRTLAAGGATPRPAAYGCRRALVALTAAGLVLGAGGQVPVAAADGTAAGPGARTAPAGITDPDNEQGSRGALHGRPLPGPAGTPAAPVIGEITRAEIMSRAKKWIDAKVPYSMSTYWSDGYRQDCSGYVSMAWNLTTNEWTGSLASFATKITRAELQPGDILLFHNPDNPTTGSHVTIFGGWTDSSRTYYTAYEQTKPNARMQATPMAYWSNSDKYLPYRYNGVTDTAPPPATTPVTTPVTPPAPVAGDTYPGAASFGPGTDNAYVARLGELLIGRGAGRFFGTATVPGSRWTDAHRDATQAFQLAQGWLGAEADGLPGEHTWRLLVNGTGKDIPADLVTPLPTPVDRPVPTGPGTVTGPARPQPAPAKPVAVKPAPAKPVAAEPAVPKPAPAKQPVAGGTAPARPAPAPPVPAAGTAPAFPGAAYFRPGQNNAQVRQLGEQLVKRGYGRHYATGPGPVWTEADRRNVQEFQLAQGWRGSEADGFPGPETWKRLFAR